MGRIAKVLEFIRGVGGKSDTKCDPGGGAIRQAPHAQQPGDDAHPLPGDYAVLVETPQSGGFAAVGYVDPQNTQTAGPGERRVYARTADGSQVVELWLKSDGSARLSNAGGYLELEAEGDVVGNGARMTRDGDVVTSDGVSLRGHTHAQGNDSDNNTEQETEPPTL